MPLTRPSPLLANKTNVRAVGNRSNEATAEDFAEIAAILLEIIDQVESLTGTQDPNPNYGTYSSLLLLQAAFPVGELNSYAIIDPGVGTPPQIALWDETDQEWVLQITQSKETEQVIVQGDEVFNKKVTDINGNEYIVVSGTLEGTDPTKYEDYSANSMFREL
ncbi:hypothetical protein [Flagellimonas sp.]|uniref:hypothetical protein n=1 Tax=Flagellimonas sp. TaxID=2058762 RepID=UPI003BA8B665